MVTVLSVHRPHVLNPGPRLNIKTVFPCMWFPYQRLDGRETFLSLSRESIYWCDGDCVFRLCFNMIYRLPSYKDCSYHKKTVVIDRRIFILGIDILVVRRRIDIDMAPIVHFITGISLVKSLAPIGYMNSWYWWACMFTYIDVLRSIDIRYTAVIFFSKVLMKDSQKLSPECDLWGICVVLHTYSTIYFFVLCAILW